MKLLSAALFCTIGILPVCANTIALEGSDATAFHQDAVYTTQLFTYLGGASLPVLVLGGVALNAAVNPALYVLDPSYALPANGLTAATLAANYSAVYIESVGGCCTQADTSITAAQETIIGAAEALGVNLGIENYGGGPAWGPILPAAVDALPSSDFGGITDFGTAGGPTCTDNEVVNAVGLAKGFIQPPVLGCYEHEGYMTSAFTALGFTSLFNADPAYFGANGSALLGTGTLSAGTPEPGTLMTMGVGLVGLAALLRRQRAAKK